jgi:hypothetical protein
MLLENAAKTNYAASHIVNDFSAKSELLLKQTMRRLPSSMSFQHKNKKSIKKTKQKLIFIFFLNSNEACPVRTLGWMA